MSEKLRRILAISLLLLFSMFTVGNIFCLHTHQSEGRVVVHSHPFLPSSHHSHTSSQFVALAIVNAIAFDDYGVVCHTFRNVLQANFDIEEYREFVFDKRVYVDALGLRGPPVVA